MTLQYIYIELLESSWFRAYNSPTFYSILAEFFAIETFNLLGSIYIDDDFPEAPMEQRKPLTFRISVHVVSIGVTSLLVSLMAFTPGLEIYISFSVMYFVAIVCILNNTNGSEGQLFENSYENNAFIVI